MRYINGNQLIRNVFDPLSEKITDKSIQLMTYPDWQDERFREPQTVFGEKCKGLRYDYSDRIWQWDYDKAQVATEKAKESGHTHRSCDWYEVYLTEYFDRPTEIKHILAGCNVSNGYPYVVFGYRFLDEESAE